VEGAPEIAPVGIAGVGTGQRERLKMATDKDDLGRSIVISCKR
jgi:hypothetical protein